MKILRTAVIGLGRIGWQCHIPEILKADGFELAAAVDTNPERLQELRDTYNVPGYTDVKEMLMSENPDLVVVASPTHLHKEQIIMSMEHGAHVFSDKPVAKNISEVYEIAEAAKKTGRKIMVYQPHRTTPIANTLKGIIASGKLGPIYMIKRANSGYTRRNDWQAFKKYGGGMLNNYGAHFIDQLRYIVNEDIDINTCVCDRIATLGDADDVVKVVMHSRSGITLDLDINQATAYPVTEFMVFGKFGTAVIDTRTNSDFLVKYIIPEECPPIEIQSTLAAAGRSYASEAPLPWHEETIPILPESGINFYSKCYEYFAEDKEAFVPFEQTIRLMELIDKCHKIAEM